MAKLTRESRLRERRLDKQAKKEARKLAPAVDADSPEDILSAASSEPERAESGPASLDAATQTLLPPA